LILENKKETIFNLKKKKSISSVLELLGLLDDWDEIEA